MDTKNVNNMAVEKMTLAGASLLEGQQRLNEALNLLTSDEEESKTSTIYFAGKIMFLLEQMNFLNKQIVNTGIRMIEFDYNIPNEENEEA